MVGNIPLFCVTLAWLMSHTARAHDSRAVLLRRMPLQIESGMRAGSLLGSISDFCRRTGMAESTFGRRAVNDGKFVARLRDGARVTPETLQRVNQFIVRNGHAGAGETPPELLPLIGGGAVSKNIPIQEAKNPDKNFRFFD